MTRRLTMGSNFLGTPSNPTKLRCAAWPATRCFRGSGPIPRPPDIPVVDLSTDAKLSQTYLLQAGAQAFLTKPIDVNELLDLVNAITAQRTHP